MKSQRTETFNEEKHVPEENIDSSFLVDAVYYLNEGKIAVPEPKHQDQLRNKGFGEVFNKEYLLNSLESLYLLHNNKILIYRNKSQYDFSTLLKSLIKKDKKIKPKWKN